MNYNNQQIENKSNNTVMFNVKDSQSCHIGARNYNKSTYPSFYVFLHTWQINNMPWGNWHASTSHNKAAAVIAPLMDCSLRCRYFFGSLLTGVCSIQLLLRFLSFPAIVKIVPLVDSAYGIPYISVDAMFLRIFAGRIFSLMVELLWSNIHAGRKLVSYAIHSSLRSLHMRI